MVVRAPGMTIPATTVCDRPPRWVTGPRGRGRAIEDETARMGSTLSPKACVGFRMSQECIPIARELDRLAETGAIL